MKTALLRLFNAVHVEKKSEEKIPDDVLKRTLRNGYILQPTIPVTSSLLDEVEKVVGISGEKANASFHKSWAVVRDSSDLELVMQQILHYITTYGFEALGVYKQETVYIPNEVLEIPEADRIPLTVVKALTSDEIREEIVELGSGIALAEETLKDVMFIVEFLGADEKFVSKIRNRELKGRLYDLLRICPSDPVEYLRYVISKLTDESLIIKNDALIEKLKDSNRKFLDELLDKAPDNLASIFFRFKPLFLALKSVSRNKTFFNRLRKKAEKMHKPMPEDYLNSVTAQIKGDRLDMDRLQKKLEGASIYRKVRLAYALKFRLNNPEAVVYRVRNGRGWASSFFWEKSLGKPTEEALEVVLDSVVSDLRTNVEGETIYIPESVHYTLPATEKQFTGNLPTGTYVTVPEDMIVGIHWTNLKRHRVDLDLSLINAQGKIGWDGSYRTSGRDVLFSGDVTDAPGNKGASELFYVKKGKVNPFIMSVNYFNYSEDHPVPCKILVAQDKAEKFGRNYMVDPNNIIALANISVSRKENTLGLLTHVDGENRFYFANVSVGKGITSSYNANAEKTRQYYVSSLVSSIGLKECLVRAGAEVVSTKPGNDFVDLSPEALDKTTITKLLRVREAVSS